MTLTAERLRSLLNYDPETGEFRWCFKWPERSRWDRRWNIVHAGNRAGTIKRGYRGITIDSKRYYAGRLAWLYMTGSWPKEQIDHRNLNRGDDRWENLREATNSQNARNKGRYATNTSGHAGVVWHTPTGKWQANGSINSRPKYLGLFSTLDEAIAARKAFEAQHYGELAFQKEIT